MPKNAEPTERTSLLQPSSAKYDATKQSNGKGTDTEVVESGPVTSEDEDPELAEARKSIKYMLPVLGTGVFLAFVDQSIIFAISEDIASELNGLSYVPWIATAFYLSMASTQPLYGKLSDVFGRKPCLLFAYAVFGIGSLGCGLSKTMGGLVAARTVQGAGAGGITVVITVLLSDVIPVRDRGTWQGYLNLIGATGSTSGAPLGGLLVQSIGWRWAFLGQVILCIIAFSSVFLCLKVPSHTVTMPLNDRLKRIDFLGALLLVLAVTALLVGLDRGSNFSWGDPLTISFLCAIIPLTALYLFVETKIAKEPVIPGHVIFNKAVFVCYAHSFFAYMTFAAFLFYLPLFFQVVIQMTPVKSGASLIPAAASGVIGTITGGVIIKRTGRFYWLATGAGIAATLGCLPLAFGTRLGRMSLPPVYIGSVIAFVPQGICVTASLIALITNVSPQDQATATAGMFLLRSLGSSVGISTCSILIRRVLQIHLQAQLEPREAYMLLDKLRKSLTLIRDLPEATQLIVRESYGAAIQACFAMCMCFHAVATVAITSWRENKLDR